ncbi:MAG: D-Ala-D-Ala carboxypeptidase family metallohydrolase [Eubacteriaceae bacterium]
MEYIKWIQEALNKQGHLLEVDGIFGEETKRALMIFQGSRKLEEDGICGEKTHNALLLALNNVMVNPLKELKYFTADEFKCECGCGGDIRQELKEKMDIAREKLGIPLVITSGYRCINQNNRDGGVRDSLHMRGSAVDCYGIGKSVDEVYRVLKQVGLGVGRYDQSGFCHAQLENWDFVGD